MPTSEGTPGRLAPFVILGAMILIAVIGLSVVLFNHFGRDEGYLEPSIMDPRDPNRLENQPRKKSHGPASE